MSPVKTPNVLSPPESTPNHTSLLIAALAIAVLSISLRLFDLEGKSLWCDELASIRRAEGSVAGLIKELLEVEHLPLYELSLHFWLRLGRSDFLIRLLSAIAGVIAVGVSYLFAKEILGRGLGLLTALMMALSSHHVLWSRIARPYSFLSLFTLLSCYLFIRVLRERRACLYVAYGVSTVLSLYTHYFACFVVLTQNLFFVVWWIKERRSLKSASAAIRDWTLCQCAMGCAFAPWLIMNLATAISESVGQVYYASQAGPLVKLLYFFFVFSLGSTVHPLDIPILAPAFIVFSIAFGVGAWRIVGMPGVIPKFVLALLFLPLALGLFVPACAPKHAVSVLPAYFVIIALGVCGGHTALDVSSTAKTSSGELCQRGTDKETFRFFGSWRSRLLIGVILVLQCVSLKNYFTNQDFADADMIVPWRSISEFVESDFREGDCIVVGYDPEHLHWYYKGGVYWKDGGGPGLYNLDNANISEQLSNIAKKHNRIWFVLHTEDPRDKVEEWMRAHGRIRIEKPYLLEEHTLKGLKEGLRSIHKYKSYMCKVYLFQRVSSL